MLKKLIQISCPNTIRLIAEVNKKVAIVEIKALQFRLATSISGIKTAIWGLYPSRPRKTPAKIGAGGSPRGRDPRGREAAGRCGVLRGLRRDERQLGGCRRRGDSSATGTLESGRKLRRDGQRGVGSQLDVGGFSRRRVTSPAHQNGHGTAITYFASR